MSPNEVYCLWLYLKDGVLTLDQFSLHLERDLSFLSSSDCHRLGQDRIDDPVIIIITPDGYLI